MQLSNAFVGESLRSPASSSRERRILFLDDDPARASIFLSERPGAVWVQSVADCINELGNFWDEIHLDHDLAGESYVSIDRDDCGMAVVRWLCEEPRPHLQSSKFIVHTHNDNAACVMLLHLQEMGFHAEARPFSARRLVRRSKSGLGMIDRLASWFA
jgi:hypothetical protein